MLSKIGLIKPYQKTETIFLQDTKTNEIGLYDDKNNRFVIYFTSTQDAQNKNCRVVNL